MGGGIFLLFLVCYAYSVNVQYVACVIIVVYTVGDKKRFPFRFRCTSVTRCERFNGRYKNGDLTVNSVPFQYFLLTIVRA